LAIFVFIPTQMTWSVLCPAAFIPPIRAVASGT